MKKQGGPWAARAHKNDGLEARIWTYVCNKSSYFITDFHWLSLNLQKKSESNMQSVRLLAPY